MGDVERPMLAECLAALTPETYVPAWEAVAPRVRLALDAALLAPPDGAEVRPGGARWEWTVAGPDEAQETLVARGLLPEGWCGDVRRGWHDRQARDDGWGDWCDVVLAAPRTIPDLVAVASLGWSAIRLAEELARAACAALREYGCPQPERVVWRVGHPQPAKEVLVVLCPWEKNNETSTWIGVDGVLHDTRWYRGAPKSKLTIGPASSLWDSGLALDAITADTVRIVVPPVGGGRG